LKIPYYQNSSYWLAYFKNSENPYKVFIPDSLVNNLVRNKVEYIIKSSLRTYPDEKTVYSCDDVSNYIFYMEARYPKMFRKVIQIGGDNEEPATLYKINYEFYNLKFIPPAHERK
jgi:hypothetical protein